MTFFIFALGCLFIITSVLLCFVSSVKQVVCRAAAFPQQFSYVLNRCCHLQSVCCWHLCCWTSLLSLLHHSFTHASERMSRDNSKVPGRGKLLNLL